MMKNGASENVKEQSQMQLTIKTEVEAATTSTAHIDTEIDLSHLIQKPGLVHSVKSEPPLLVKEEIVEDSSQIGNEPHSVQGTSTPAGTGSVDEACSTSLADLFNVKHELEGMDIGPTVLQHMDIHYTINKIDLSHLIQKPGLVHSVKSEPPLLVKEEIVEDSSQIGNEPHSVQGTSTPAGTGSVDEACSTSLADLFNVKHELEGMDIGPTVLQHMDIHYTINKIDLSHLIQKPGLVHSVKSEPPLLVKEEIVEDSSQIGNEPHSVQGTSTPAGTGSVDEACSTSLAGLFNVKHELEGMDIGPTVLQHMDIHYTINKIDLSHLIQKPGLVHSVKSEPPLLVKEEIVEDSSQNNKTITCKYCHQMKTEEDYNETHLKSCDAQQTDLQQHLLSQHQAMKSGDFECNACKTFHRSQMLSAHKKFHKRSDSKTCITTSSAIASSIQSQDETVKMKGRLLICDHYEKVYSSKSGLNFRKYSHSGIKLSVCHICDAKFCAEVHLARHLLIHTSEKPYLSITCDSRFAQSNSLGLHKKIAGEKPYLCDTCDARFIQKGALSKHKIIHTDGKPYQCDTFSARFTRKGALSRHKKIHTGEKPYQCDTCDVRFADSSTLNQHKKIHTGEKPYQCDTCDARFIQKGALSKHKITHTGEKPYQCDTCDVRFAESSILNQHKKIHTGEKPYQCDTCDARFTQKKALSQHMTIHTGEKPYRCDTCDARFTEKGSLNRHKIIHTGENPYQCDTCDARFKQRGALTRHKKIHTGEKPYQCDTCDARFIQKWALSAHKKNHTGEKPYQCNTCNARFTRKGVLSVHMKIHTGEKPYRCDTCDARFTEKGSLNRHKKIHTGEKPYQCDTCDARFIQKGALSAHKKIHTGERPYQCDTCEARFAHSYRLNQHKKIHTGEKPYQCDTCEARFAHCCRLNRHKKIHTCEKHYQCDTCDARFKQKSALSQHMTIHTGEKPYRCDTCDARFTKKGSLNRHKIFHTGEKPYQCDTCDAKFTYSSTLYKHKKIHTGEKPLPV